MIAFKIGDEFLDLNPNTSVGIELYNPLFQKADQTPGTLTYTITLPYTRKNQRILGNPENLSLATPPATDFACQFYINNILWKIGILKYRGFTGVAYSVNFQGDAGDFSSKIKDVKMQAVDYASAVLSASVKDHLTDSYALFPVKNSLFYGDTDAPAGWNNYVNFYSSGFSGPLVPYPFVKYILQQILTTYGYSMSGDWLDEDYVKRLVIYNNYTTTGTVNFKKHVPDIKISDFLAGLRQLFGIAYVFDANSKVLKFVRYKDVIADTSYIDWTNKTEKTYSEDTVDRTGFTLKQTVEENDELNKTLPIDWAEYKIGSGGEAITTSASILHMIRESQGGRNWLIPATEQKGTSQATGTGENNKFSLRFLLYAGLQAASSGSYPLGSAVNENFAATPFTDRSLHYAGQWGLYEKNWKEWAAFLDQTRPIQRGVLLSMSDLLTLSPTRKIMIDHVKYFYERITLTVSSKDGIGKAKIDLKKVNV